MTDELRVSHTRVASLLGTLERLAAGDTTTSIEFSPSHDEFDAIAFGINVLADELRFVHGQMTEAAQNKARESHEQMQEAERASEAKTVFLRNASHEIRTPISIILSIAEVLAMPDLPTHERADLARKLRANCRAVLSLVGNLLDLSRLEVGGLTPVNEPVSPAALVREVVESLEPHAHGKGLKVEVAVAPAVPSTVSTDSLRLRQVLVNVIGNAVKYTEQGSVFIQVGRESDYDGELIIDVADTGPGIAVERRQLIFEPFGHADSPIARVQGGTGLGLAISRRLAEQLGGTLSLLDSCRARGSTFRLAIKADRVAAPTLEATREPGEAGGSPGRPLDGMRILLAEDSMELQSAVRRLLRAVGATIECANDGREATSMANTHRYDAILMDLVMPHVSGIQATQALRSNGQDMPIIAFTGDATAEVYQAARDAGCDEVLSKPFDASHLIATIRTLVARQRSQTADTER